MFLSSIFPEMLPPASNETVVSTQCSSLMVFFHMALGEKSSIKIILDDIYAIQQLKFNEK